MGALSNDLVQCTLLRVTNCNFMQNSLMIKGLVIGKGCAFFIALQPKFSTERGDLASDNFKI